MKAILVEDNEIFRSTLKRFLEIEFAIQIIAEFRDGEEFLRYNSVHLANYVFMDLELPGINGLNATRIAQWEHNNIKFIAVSAHTSEEYMFKVVEAGFDAYINKHNMFEELPQALENLKNGKKYFFSLDNNISSDSSNKNITQ